MRGCGPLGIIHKVPKALKSGPTRMLLRPSRQAFADLLRALRADLASALDSVLGGTATSSGPGTTVKLPKPAKIPRGSALQRLAMGATRGGRRRC